jgi:hypothetical protein
MLLALSLGGLLLGAGVLLFVSAHWDNLSPGERFSLVLLMVAAFPVAGALTAKRLPALSMTLYAVGTLCTGAGIFLAAQIFNLEEHWPNGVLMWAVAALVAWLALRQWPQAVLLALLVPAWLTGEWTVRTERFPIDYALITEGLLLLAITYLSARNEPDDSANRQALGWIGGLGILPLAIFAFVERHEFWLAAPNYGLRQSFFALALAWTVAIAGPLVLALFLRKGKAWTNATAAAWVLGITTFHAPVSYVSGVSPNYIWDSMGPYLWAGLGAVGLIAWGVTDRRRERINLGVAGFAITLTVFYFSDVMDKLGRSASLIGAGALLLIGGRALERTRRKLIARMEGNPA